MLPGAVLQFSLIEATDVLTEAPVASPIAESPIADSISNDLTEPPSDAVPTEPPTPYIIADTEAPSKLNVNTLGHATIQYVLYNDLLSYNQSDVGFGTALAASATELFIGTNREGSKTNWYIVIYIYTSFNAFFCLCVCSGVSLHTYYEWLMANSRGVSSQGLS